MTNSQLYFAIGVPIIVNVVFNGMIIGIMWAALDRRINRLEDKIEVLTGKVATMDNEIVRIKERLGIKD